MIEEKFFLGIKTNIKWRNLRLKTSGNFSQNLSLYILTKSKSLQLEGILSNEETTTLFIENSTQIKQKY